MNLLFRGAACAPLLALLAGCCANNANSCDDLQEDSLYVVLANDPAGAGSFTRAELDTVYLQRYSPAKAAVPAIGATLAKAATAATFSDPVAIVQARQTTVSKSLASRLTAANFSTANTLVISNTTPFAPSATGGKLSAYSYLVKVHDLSVKGAPTYVDTLTQIQLQGRYNADGCTTCYENTQKTVVRKGRTTTATIDVTEEVKDGIKVPVAIPISKLD